VKVLVALLLLTGRVDFHHIHSRLILHLSTLVGLVIQISSR
jgi:hypothetical protein